jgi:hypothetical protein
VARYAISIFVPHAGQNRAPGSSAWPQFAQKWIVASGGGTARSGVGSAGGGAATGAGGGAVGAATAAAGAGAAVA